MAIQMRNPVFQVVQGFYDLLRIALEKVIEGFVFSPVAESEILI